jgi:hypothetical protein
MTFGTSSDPFGQHPANLLAAQGIRIRSPKKLDQPDRRAVTDLIAMNICARNAHFFSEGRYPTNTTAAIMGLLLHRIIKHLHGRYLAAQFQGPTGWVPDEQAVLEECQIAEEAARMQGLPQLYPGQREQLRRMLTAFHTIEARWFYPRIHAAEVSLSWLWEDSPKGSILLEGKVDVVLIHDKEPHPLIALWDYKTGRQPRTSVISTTNETVCLSLSEMFQGSSSRDRSLLHARVGDKTSFYRTSPKGALSGACDRR